MTLQLQERTELFTSTLPWEGSPGGLFRRWLDTVRFGLRSPSKLAAGVLDATADGAIRFMLFSFLLTSPLEPLVYALIGVPSSDSLESQLAAAAVRLPIRAVFGALLFSLIYWLAASALGGSGSFSLALRAYAYSIGTLAPLLGLSNLLLLIDVKVGLGIAYCLAVTLLALQWRCLRLVAIAGFQLSRYRSAVAASAPYATVVLLAGMLFAVAVMRGIG